MYKRIFLIVLDSVGIGEAPDADKYGDVGSNTIRSISTNPNFSANTMSSLGLFNVDGVDYHENYENPIGAYGKLTEVSSGKDTTTGHWEMMGIISDKPFPTFPDGFPADFDIDIQSQNPYCKRPIWTHPPRASVFTKNQGLSTD